MSQKSGYEELEKRVRELEKAEAECRMAEAALRESEGRFRVLFEKSRDAIFIAGRDSRFAFVNQAACELTGYSEKELLSMAIPDLHEPQDLSAYNRFFHRIMSGEDVLSEADLLRKDGTKRPVEFSNTRVFIDTHPFMHTTARDLSRQKQAEQEKLRARKAAAEHEKYALVGQIAGKMAHDFNNILGAMMGNTELALVDCRDPETRETLALLLNLINRGRNLTKNLVAFAKDQEPREAYFPLNPKIDLVLNLMKRDLQGVRVLTQPDPDLPDLLADPGMVEHCLVNLIQNAVHAMSREDDPCLLIRTCRRGEWLEVAISDNGCGIPEPLMDKIFEPAFTLKGSRDETGDYAPDIKGTGYGMANVKKYMEQHNGTVTLESEKGSGTTVTIRFPIVEKKIAREATISLPDAPVCSGKKILIVEDEATISDVQYRMLTQGNCCHDVDTASDGRAAVALIDRHSYDAVSLDYVLPGNLNGMDVYAHIRRTDKTLPVLFISGNLEFLESVKDLTRKDPHVDHVSKPCRNEVYVDRINRLLTLKSGR